MKEGSMKYSGVLVGAMSRIKKKKETTAKLHPDAQIENLNEHAMPIQKASFIARFWKEAKGVAGNLLDVSLIKFFCH